MQKKKKSPFRFLIWLIILIVLIFFGVKWYLGYLQSPVDKNGKVEAFVVKKGETVSEVADRLEKERFIRSSLIFKYLYNQNQKESAIQAGDFKISSAMSTEEIIKTLSQGAVDKWVTLLEGWRNEQMADELNAELGISKEEFLKQAKQGFMFPDTYLFNPKASVSTIVSILENTFDQKYTDELKNKIKAKGLTPEQGVILASIVEREARSDEVRTQVASILLKRLKMGMALNADATVQYAKDTASYKNGTLKKFWQPVTQADYKEVISPFNTYLHPGLPPAPISNPSVSSLKAVANAISNTPYTYYYHDSKGNSYYATTLEEHNENVANHP
jgi:UPF0755 protein